MPQATTGPVKKTPAVFASLDPRVLRFAPKSLLFRGRIFFHFSSQSRQRGSTEESMSHASRHSYLAHLSLYRLGKRIVHNQVFRDAQGKPTDRGLKLSIADLVPWDDDGEVTAAGLGPLSRAELESLTFIVPFSKLCEALTWGEEQQALEEQTPAPEFTARAGQKQVHFNEFDWSEPDKGQEEEDKHRGDGEDDEGDRPGRRSRSSKRRRMSADERPYRDRSSRSQNTSQIPTQSSSRIAQGQEP